MSETIVYPGKNNSSKQLELAKWILDPSSRPELVIRQKQNQEFGTRSASTSAESKCNVQKQLELVQLILDK